MEFYQILRAARQFERAFAQRISPVLERWSLTTGEMQVLLSLANNPGCDTARDMVVVRGLGKPQPAGPAHRPAGHYGGRMACGPGGPGGAGPVRPGAV